MDNLANQAIVVGIDGSANSDAALDWAVAEATRRQRRLFIFSAGTRRLAGGMATYSDFAGDAELSRLSVVAAEESLTTASARARELSPDLVITTGSAVDRAAGALVDLSARADTIVVGRSGHGPAIGALLGSVALQVVTHASCPVVVVHAADEAATGPGPVVVGVDGSAESELALGYAFEQASLRGARLDVVHAWWTTLTGGPARELEAQEVPQERLALSEAMVGWSEKYPDVEVTQSIALSPAVPAIIEAAQDAGLLVVGSRGRGGFRSLLLGSVSQAVVRHAPCTVAVVRPQRTEGAS